jgi:hypothetical protein
VNEPTSICMRGWAKVPAELLTAGLSDRAKLLWVVLERHQGARPDSWPSRSHLAEHLGCSLPSLKRVIAELEASGWIRVQRSAGGRTRTNRYVVIHNGVTHAPVSTRNGFTGDPVGPETGSPVNPLTGSPVTPRKSSRELHSGNSSAQGATARVCELGRLIADDGSCCPEHDYGQIPMWPVAVSQT